MNGYVWKDLFHNQKISNIWVLVTIVYLEWKHYFSNHCYGNSYIYWSNPTMESWIRNWITSPWDLSGLSGDGDDPPLSPLPRNLDTSPPTTGEATGVSVTSLGFLDGRPCVTLAAITTTVTCEIIYMVTSVLKKKKIPYLRSYYNTIEQREWGTWEHSPTVALSVCYLRCVIVWDYGEFFNHNP